MAPACKVVVRLTDDQRDALDRLLQTGSHPAAMRRRAAILLRADADGLDAWTDEEIADHLETTRMTVMRVRQQFASAWTAESRTWPPCVARCRPVSSAGTPPW